MHIFSKHVFSKHVFSKHVLSKHVFSKHIIVFFWENTIESCNLRVWVLPRNSENPSSLFFSLFFFSFLVIFLGTSFKHRVRNFCFELFVGVDFYRSNNLWGLIFIGRIIGVTVCFLGGLGHPY
jgi:hypothetical protein